MEIFAGRKRIASKVVLCDTLFRQAKGLMFRSTPLKMGEVYFFTIGGPIHMAFVRFPIDVVWLDSSMRIVDVQRAQPGWRVYYPKKGGSSTSYVMEMRAGAAAVAAARGLKIGKKIRCITCRA